MRRKSPKTHQGPPGPWTPGEGGVAPFDPLASCPSGIVCDNLNPQTSSEAILPRHGLTTESMATVKHREKNKTDLPTQLKVANRSIFLAEGSPARCVSERKKGGNPRTGKVQGRSPWRAFGDFPRDGKVTRGGGAERPPHRGVQRGHRPLAKKFPPLDERNISFLHRLEAVVQKAVEDDAAFWVKQEEPSPFRDGGQLPGSGSRCTRRFLHRPVPQNRG